ncbi:YvrJ family protein [Marinococcus halophilus]|uniref:YvrJ family protein n=1 Tax=Marinococcus halophilus TaxID=1371 RepID=A0A510Y9Y2_MARHA|nr:YvrJ family protein [Marinococcus halophilus]OZT78864.1 YvrJ family protein [Marinococcus halophilus]GEK60158.1 hypothetical protein MHA01_30630 [Marinococcus halophilus]
MHIIDSSAVVELLANVGFPIVVTFYLLLRIEQRIEHLRREVTRLACSSPKKEDPMHDD